MSLSKIDEFLEEVVKEVRFKYDRKDIKKELLDHIEESIDNNINAGFSKEEASEIAIENMGDATLIGKELNKEHNIFLGYFYILIKNIFYFVVATMLVIFLKDILSLSNFPIDKKILKNDIVLHAQVNEKIEMDNRVINIKDAYITNYNELIIYYETYTKNLKVNDWSFRGLGQEYIDDLGNKYNIISSSSRTTFYKDKCIDIIRDFNIDANEINIKYDQFNRKYEINIKLKEGV